MCVIDRLNVGRPPPSLTHATRPHHHHHHTPRSVLSNPNIEVVWNSTVQEVRGDGSKLTGLLLRDTVKGDVRELPVQGLFLAIGHTPASAFLDGQLALDEEGYVKTAPDQSTSVEGVWSAGDVQDR